MDLKQIIYLFSDGSLNDLLTIITRDFKVLSFIVGVPLIWLLRKYTKWTPWNDGKIVNQIAEKLGIETEGDKK